MVYTFVKNDDYKFPAKFAFSVSTKNIKKAVERNLIKRRMREIVRLSKQALYQDLERFNVNINIMLIFTGREVRDYKAIQQAIQKGFIKLINEISERHEI